MKYTITTVPSVVGNIMPLQSRFVQILISVTKANSSAQSSNPIRVIELAPDNWIVLIELSDQFRCNEWCLNRVHSSLRVLLKHAPMSTSSAVAPSFRRSVIYFSNSDIRILRLQLHFDVNLECGLTSSQISFQCSSFLLCLKSTLAGNGGCFHEIWFLNQCGAKVKSWFFDNKMYQFSGNGHKMLLK